MKKSLRFLLVALALGQALSAWAQQRAPVKQPNILIVADDMNWDSPAVSAARHRRSHQTSTAWPPPGCDLHAM